MAVYDNLGKEMYRTQRANASLQLDFSTWVRGIYFLCIVSKEKRVVKKVVIQ